MCPPARKVIAEGPGSEFGANEELARAAGPSRQFYLVPGADVLCLVDAGGQVACNGSEAATRGQVAMVSAVGNNRTLSGALPAGASDGEAITDKGTHIPLSAADGVYSVELDSPVQGVSFVLDGEPVSVPIASG